MPTRMLVLDTCAVLKFFLREPGTGTVRWIVRNRVRFGFSLSVSVVVGLEFEIAVWKKVAYGQIDLGEARAVLQRSKGYFRDVFHVRDEEPIPAQYVKKGQKWERHILIVL